jgi:hypothetical protein
MATRTLIGIPKHGGRYNARWLHWGEHPSELIGLLRRICTSAFGGDPAALTATLLAHDWSDLRPCPHSLPGPERRPLPASASPSTTPPVSPGQVRSPAHRPHHRLRSHRPRHLAPAQLSSTRPWISHGLPTAGTQPTRHRRHRRVAQRRRDRPGAALRGARLALPATRPAGPAPVVAQALGFHHHTTQRHHAAAGGTWNRYAPARDG